LRVMRAIEVCRTASLGGHVDQCSQCEQITISYNSCRNRHCPKCQNGERAEWLEQRKAELLPVQYFHVVFTVPEPIAAIAFYHPRTVYGILFQAAAETLQTIAADRKHLGAAIGFFAVLHTWGQNLLHHPHLHCVIAGGGLDRGRKQWIGCRPGFFLSVRVLSRLFRRLFLQALQEAFDQEKLSWPGGGEPLQERDAFRRYLLPLRQAEWVVYAKPPFGGPQQVLEYLGRYTHRVALSNERLLAADNQEVTFRWKDYRHAQAVKTMTLSADDFIRRFLLHVLPSGFQRIRYFGFLANRTRKESLALCRELLTARTAGLLPEPQQCRDVLEGITARQRSLCRHCGIGTLIRVQILPAYRWNAQPPDSS
jgi:hypothetical protein